MRTIPQATVAAVLIVVGGSLLAYGATARARHTESTTVGPFQLTVTDTSQFNAPLWGGLFVAIVGVGLFVTAGRKA